MCMDAAKRWWGVALLLLATVGCNSGPGRGGTSLFPQGHTLTPAAKELRLANARPLMLPRELEKQPLPAYTVEPGDILLVQPADLDSPVRIPSDQPILPDGSINLGKYGQLIVMGRTVSEIEQMVRSAVLTQTKDAGPINVRIIARQSKVYYVVGEVNSPGAFQLNGRETVLDAIMQAGGLSVNASRENIILSRPTKPNCPRIVLPVCWKQIVQEGDTTTNYQIAPGDRIYVPTSGLLESIPFLGRHCGKLCNSLSGCASAFAMPPYPGDACFPPADRFHGEVGASDPSQSPIRPVSIGKQREWSAPTESSGGR